MSALSMDVEFNSSETIMQPVFRFAPSPNGFLHLGHALSALINLEAARRLGGRFLLRIEDIDVVRCTQAKKQQMFDDLQWLGLEWEEPVLHQSQRFDAYREALGGLQAKGLVYPNGASRKQIQVMIEEWEKAQGRVWPRDPDGAVHFPRDLLRDCERGDEQVAWRLDMDRALITVGDDLLWQESGPGNINHPKSGFVEADPSRWGDVVLARKDCPTSYHLSVVLDDALQGVTHIVRGQDLFEATSIHRLLQNLLGLPQPLYHHHRLLRDEGGEKLSKSRGTIGIKTLRETGVTPDEIRRQISLSDKDLEAFGSMRLSSD